MPLKITVHSVGSGTCALTAKEDLDGLTVSFEDGTVSETFLSWRAFRQLINLKAPAVKAKSPAPKSDGQLTSK